MYSMCPKNFISRLHLHCHQLDGPTIGNVWLFLGLCYFAVRADGADTADHLGSALRGGPWESTADYHNHQRCRPSQSSTFRKDCRLRKVILTLAPEVTQRSMGTRWKGL